MTFIPIMSGSAVRRDHLGLNNIPYQCALFNTSILQDNPKTQEKHHLCPHPQYR